MSDLTVSPPLEDIDYDSIVLVELTVREMLAIQSALFDAANYNRQHKWFASEEQITKLRIGFEKKTDIFINEADRKVTEWLEARKQRINNA